MAAWHEAQRAWERTQPQLFFEVDDLTSLPGVSANGDPCPHSSRGFLPPAETPDAGTVTRSAPGSLLTKGDGTSVVVPVSVERPASALNNTAASSQSSWRARELAAEGV